MDLFGDLFQSVGGLAGYIVPFLFVLAIVVFFHELGHFLVARWCNVKVLVFSIGFGKELFGWTDRRGTRWKLSAIPLGGYVKFSGDEGAASTPDHDQIKAMSSEEREGAFHTKNVAQRSAVVAAGPIANFLLAIVIFALLFSLIGRPITQPRVDTVTAESAAAAAGFEPGDLVLAIDGAAIESFSDMQRIVSMSADRELSIVVDRNGQEETLLATPRTREITDRFGNTQRIGLLGISRSSDPDSVIVKRYGPLQATAKATGEVYFIIDRTLTYLWRLIAGRESADQLGGPIRIAQVSGQVASVGFDALLQLTAILSVSIGLLNLFPIPMLDGGHLVFYAIEAVRGRPLSEATQAIGYRIGLAIVVMLMVFATWNDIARLL